MIKSDKKIRILFVSHNLELEGAPKSFFMLAEWLKKSGHDVEAISLQDGPLIKNYKKNNIPVKIKNYFKEDLSENDKRKYDIFIVNTLVGYSFIKKMSKFKKKIIWIIRENEFYQYKKRYPDLELSLLEEVFKVVFVSDATRKLYENSNENKFITIHNGFDLKNYENYINKIKKISSNRYRNIRSFLRNKYSFSEEDKIIILVGTLCLHKGQIEFSKAAQKIVESLSEEDKLKIKFLIVGAQDKDQKYFKAIEKYINENGLAKNILLLKETAEIYDYFVLSDIFVCNSFIESFPRVILEAMAFGLPIVATSVYGIPEQIEDGKDGLLVQAGDIYDLSEKIKKLLYDEDLADYLGKNAKKKLQEKFTHERTMQSFEDLINQLN